MASEAPELDLPVPDDLLQAAVSRTRVERTVAEAALVPGMGAGTPPPLSDLMRTAGVAGLGLMTAAAVVPATLDAGIAVLGPDIQDTFGLSDAGLGALVFASSASTFVLGVPVALWGDRGQRVRTATFCLLVWVLAVPFMAAAPSPWLFALFAVIAGFGRAAPNSVHLSYLSDAYPVEARARVLALHRAHEPLGRTVGAAAMGGIAALAGGAAGWRWALLVGLAALPVVPVLARVREPAKGAHEQRHVLDASGVRDGQEDDAQPPRILLGTAVQRLLRIRSLYFQLIAMAVLGFAAVGIPLLGSLYLERQWDLGPGQRGLVYAITGGALFLGIPVAGLVGDRLYRRGPQLLLYLAGASLAAFGVIYASSLYLPSLPLVVAGFVLAEACLAPLGTAITQTVAATAPPALRSLAFALFGIFSLVFGGFVGGVVLGAISDATSARFALTQMGPITITGGLLLALGARHVRADMTLIIEEILDEHQEQLRRRQGGGRHALQVHHVDFAYGSQQVLFDVDLEVEEGEVCALLGTNGAGKSTLLRAVAGLEHPSRGTIRVFGSNTTYLEAEQIVAMGVSMLPGGRMTFPSLSVEENLRAGSFSMTNRQAVDDGVREALDAFPVLAARAQQPAGTLSGGEQQMLALARTMIQRPRLLLVDELTLGLAPKVVEELLDIVRTINARGTTVILVEQSANLALTLADHAVFLERGQIRFDGRTSDLLDRDDLLRPVFLAETSL